MPSERKYPSTKITGTINPVFKRILLSETEEKKEESFEDKVNEIDQRFYLLLEDYKKYYIQHNLYKESSDLESAFMREETMLENNKQNTFLLKNEVNNALNKERTEIRELEELLEKERNDLKTNTQKERALQGLDNAALQMLDDKNVIYNKRLITIFNVVVGIIATSVLIYKVPRSEHIL